MASSAMIMYGANKDDIRVRDLESANLRWALVGSAYTPDVTATGHALWAAVSANEIANGNGYATGGFGVTGVAAANVANTGWKLSSGNAVWTATGAGFPAWRYAVLYYLGTLWGQVNPLIGYILGDTTPADIPATTPATSPLTIACPATGWFDIV